jgi:Tat protein translocase TatB subunit
MFGIGTSEILIILLIALLVLGPNEIPKLAKSLGRGMRELERAKNELRNSIEFDIEEKENREAKKPDEAAGGETSNEETAAEEENAVKNPTSNSHV